MSHVNMQVFWSGTDTATIKELASQGWIAATVFNKREEHRSAISYVAETPFGKSVEIQDNIDMFIMDDFAGNVEAWDKEYDANVEKTTYTGYHGGGYSHVRSEADWRRNEYEWPPSLLDERRKSKGVDDGAPNVGESEYFKTGYYGYGAEAEAKIVGMTPKQYVHVLEYGTAQQVNQIDIALEFAVQDGRLK